LGLENLRSVFQADIEGRISDYQTNQPLPGGNPESTLTSIAGTHFEPSPNNSIILDTFLREPSAFVSEDLITKFYTEQNFDSRTPKAGTTISNINTYKGTRFVATSPTDYSSAGIGELPFTPTSQLGLDLYHNQSWQNLYSSDHTPLDEPTFGNITPISYPNVDRDNLNIRSGGAVGSLFSFPRTEDLGDGLGEPYIVSSIPESGTDSLSGRSTNSGNRSFPIGRVESDTLRLTKYLSSPAGIAFIAKQNLLGMNSQVQYVDNDGQLVQSKQRFKSTYNPTSTLTQTLGRVGTTPIALLDRTEPGLQSLFGTDEYPNLIPFVGNVPYSINDTFVNGSAEDGGFGLLESLGRFANRVISNVAGTPTVIKTGGGDKMTLAKMIQGEQLVPDASTTVALNNDLKAGTNSGPVPLDIESPKNGMPFYFKDLRSNSYIFFRAYIEGLTENVSPSWSSHNYIGRSEPVYVYERGEREINFTLKLVAQTKHELSFLRSKINHLTSLCYPEYKKDEPLSKLSRMKPPLTKLRMGELYGSLNNELLGFIKSLSYTVDESSPWETKQGERVPRHISVNIAYQIIHSEVPRDSSQFYGYGKEGLQFSTTNISSIDLGNRIVKL